MNYVAWTAVAASCLAAPLAQAAGEVLSGDQGYHTVEVRDADLYVADETFRVLVEQTNRDANIGVIVRASPAGATWHGGSIVGMGVNRTESWAAIYTRLGGPGNGACLITKNSERMTVEHLRCDWTWDGFRPEGDGNEDWLLRLAWISNNRDDAIENDRCHSGRMEHSLLEDTFVGYSSRPGQESVPCEHRLEMVGMLISLGRHYDDREKAIRPWSNIENGRVMQSGALFKVRDRGAGTEVLLKDTIIKLDHTPGVSTKELPIVPEGWELLPGSGNNTLVWLGENDLPGLTYEEIDGCKVPAEFKVPQDFFRVVCGTEGKEIWNAAKVALLAKIDPPAPPPSEPDPVDQFIIDLLRLLEAERALIEEFEKQRSEPEG